MCDNLRVVGHSDITSLLSDEPSLVKRVQASL